MQTWTVRVHEVICGQISDEMIAFIYIIALEIRYTYKSYAVNP